MARMTRASISCSEPRTVSFWCRYSATVGFIARFAAPWVIQGPLSSALHGSLLLNASHPARCVACEDVRSHPVLVALVGECSIPVV